MTEISITQTPSGPVTHDTLVTLAVSVSPDPTRYTYSWEQPDGSQADGRAMVVTASWRKQGRYRVTATPKRAGAEALTAEHTLQLTEQSPPATAPPPPNSYPPLVFDPWFAAGSAILVLVFGLLLLAPLAYRLYDTDASDAVDRMATLTSMALLSIGAVVILLGVYGALLEVRGRLGASRRRDESSRVREERPLGSAVVDGIGGLGRTVVLLLVIGCVPLVAAAWVAQSGVDNESGTAATPTARAATRTPSPAPSATPTPLR